MPLILRIKKIYHFFKSFLLKALPATIRNGFPARKLQVYAITGTDGKTTSSTLLYHVLKENGYKVALISTVAAYIGKKEIDTGFHVTSPEHWQVQQLLAKCGQEGIEHVVLEVTSHGIFQYRTWGIPIKIAGLTNISHEHLDYFVNYQSYLETKAQLLTAAQTAIIPARDRSHAALKKYMKTRRKAAQEFSERPQDPGVRRAAEKRFPELYNQKNAALVEGMAQEIGLKPEQIATAIESFPGVKGRLEKIENDRGLHLIVDFAHTPQAQESVLTALRERTKGKLWVVFGCAAQRDRTKRPLMGEISTRLADFVVLTTEDSRGENIQVIFRHIKEGIREPNFRKVTTIPDRRAAIHFALQNAKRGDTIAVLGKGHETSMNLGSGEIPWSDQKVLRELLAERG